MSRNTLRLLSLGLVEIIVASLTWLIASTPQPALATPASPTVVGTAAGPAGITIDSPWLSDAAGTTAWAYGVTASSYGNLVTYKVATGTFTTTQFAYSEVGAIGAAYSASANVGAFTVSRTGFGNRVVLVDLATGAKIASRQMASDENAIRALAFDSAGTNVWLATNTNPLRIYKIAVSTGNQSSSLILSTPFKDATSAVNYGGTLLLTLNTSPVRILPISMATNTNSPSTSLPLGTPALVDPVVSGGIAYYGSDGTPGRVTAIDLATLTVVGYTDLGADEAGAHALTVDSANGRVYTTTSTSGGPRLVTIDSRTWTRLGQRDLGAGTAAQGSFLTGHRLTVGFGGTRGVTTLSTAPAPDAPRSVSAIESDRALDVTWSAPSSLEPVTAYTVTATGDGATTTCSTAALSCRLSGLLNGTAYSIAVTATSIAGASSATELSGSPFTTPDAPTEVVASRRDRGLDVMWSAPSSGGRPILDYTATATPGGSSCTSSDTTCRITGLDNGTSFTVRVTARTSAGTSPASLESSPVTPATVPNPVRTVIPVRGDRSIAVQWDAPSDDGGRPVTRYIVTTDPTSAGCESDTTSCTVTGLTNGASYRVQVVAINEVGPSDVTQSETVVTPATIPDSVRTVTVTRGDRSVHVDWQTPTDDGGDTLTGYRVIDSSTGELVCAPVAPACTITGLTNGAEYRFNVIAVNAVGYSIAVRSDLVIPARRPAPIAAPIGTRGDRSVHLDWDEPAGNAGVPVLGYTVADEDGVVVCATAIPTCDVSGLTNGRPYRFSVVATNEVGSADPSALSAASVPATVPRRPQAPTTFSGNGGGRVTWSAVDDDGGDAVVNYIVRIWWEASSYRVINTTSTTLDLDGLTNGEVYRVTVAARNTIGESVASEAALISPLAPIVEPPVVEPPIVDPPVIDPPIVNPPIVDPPVVPPNELSAPSEPTGVILVRKNRRTLVVAWAEPDNGGSVIRDYVIERSAKPFGRFVRVTDPLSSSPIAEIPRPKRGPLFMRVIAVNAVGVSLPSAAVRILAR